MEDSQKQKAKSRQKKSVQINQGEGDGQVKFDISADLVGDAKNIDFILNLPLELTVEYGRARKKIDDLIKFERGTVVELSQLKGEPVDVLANDKLIAKGEVIVEDDKYGIKITEIVSRLERIKGL